MEFEALEGKLFCELVVQTVLSLIHADYRQISPSQSRGLYVGGHADYSDFQSVHSILEHCGIIDRELSLCMHISEIHGHLGDKPGRFGIDLPWMVEAFLLPTWNYLPDNPWGDGLAGVGKPFVIQGRLRPVFLLFQKLGYATLAQNRASWTQQAGLLLYAAGGCGVFTPVGILGYDEVVRMAKTLPGEFKEIFRSNHLHDSWKAESIVAKHWYRNAWHKEAAFGDADVTFRGAHEKAHYIRLFFRGDFPSRQEVLSGACMKADRQ